MATYCSRLMLLACGASLAAEPALPRGRGAAALPVPARPLVDASSWVLRPEAWRACLAVAGRGTRCRMLGMAGTSVAGAAAAGGSAQFKPHNPGGC